MAANIERSTVDDVLESLGLKHFYPEKLSRNDLYQISQESLDQDKSKSAAVWQFIYNITRYNYQARNIQSERKESTNTSKMGFRERTRKSRVEQKVFDHPLDVISSLFLCCDPVARQDLSMHLWGCKLALPLSLQPEQSKPPLMYIWPLRSIIGQFQDRNTLLEMPLVKKGMTSIAMVRVGENIHYSKSNLLNCLIGGPEKAHPIFFHRNSEGSKPTRSPISNGLIEIGWYMPSDSKAKRFNGPRIFLNLRGNAEHLKSQRQLIGRLATVTVILSTVANIANTKCTIEDLINQDSHVLLLISDNSPDDDAIGDFVESNFSDLPDSKFDIVTVGGCMMSELLEKLYYNISRLGDASRRNICLDEVINLPETICKVDENDQSYLNATTIAKSIIHSVQNENYEDRKEKMLPLQDSFWKEWSEKERDFYRYDELEPSEREQYGNRKQLEYQLINIRNNEYKHFLKHGLSAPVKHFIFALSKLEEKSRKIFLRLIKLEFDNLSRTQLTPLYEEYQQLLNNMTDAPETERIQLNERLNELDNQTSKLSLGLEHIIREIGQIYEAFESQPGDQICTIEINGNTIHYTELPKFACLVLAEGYSIEILDGDTCSVPLRWIKAVLRELPSVLINTMDNLTEIKVNIVSILGIQSSGKSTFLNTVFGLQFAVSAGRCTRGAFFQLVKIHSSLKENIDANYVLVIDTEGLKAAELISLDSHKKDNELSTFVIGLADTTVINLMGENAAYLHENLPIVVHAFLRMNLAGLNPRCTIVHHNVDKRNKEKLLQQGRILEQVLNKLTYKACEVENIPQKLFKDIIDFSISRHTDYIPALFEGDQPMAPVSTGYSKESDEIRTKLVQFIKDDANAYSLTRFSNRLENLWCAIKTDRFVYEFRTTLEAEAKLELENGYSDILLCYINKLDNIILTVMPRVTTKEITVEGLERNFIKLISKEEKESERTLRNFLEKPRKINCFDQWKNHFIEKFRKEVVQNRKKTLEMFRQYYTDARETVSTKIIDTFFSNVERMQRVTQKSATECFYEEWDKLCHSQQLVKDEESIMQDTFSALKQIYPSRRNLFPERLLETHTLSNFQPSVENHLNFDSQTVPVFRTKELKAKMNRLKLGVECIFNNEIESIIQSQMGYTDRIPKKIILKISRFLTDKLKKENESREISNKFEVELLLCLAGSIVEEFKKHRNTDLRLEQIKSHMKRMILPRVVKNDTETIVEIVFYAIETIIFKDIHSIIPRFLQDGLQKSHWKYRIMTKGHLIGFCLIHMIQRNDDSMIKKYYMSPEIAVEDYLKNIFDAVIEEELFLPSLRKHIAEYINHLLLPLHTHTKARAHVDELMDVMFIKRGLNVLTERVIRFKESHLLNTNIDLDVLKECMEERNKNFRDLIVNKVKDKCLSKGIRNANTSVCARYYCKRLIGCTELCPLCNEICRFAEGHRDQHECAIHRPVWCEDYVTRKKTFQTCTDHSVQLNTFIHNDKKVPVRWMNYAYPDWKQISNLRQNSSKIWKWLYANKSHLFRDISKSDIPDMLGSDGKWRCSVESVILTIKDEFEILSA